MQLALKDTGRVSSRPGALERVKFEKGQVDFLIQFSFVFQFNLLLVIILAIFSILLMYSVC